MHTTLIRRCDVAAYHAWSTRRSGPAYMRGLPTWVWQSAMSGCRPCRAQPIAVT